MFKFEQLEIWKESVVFAKKIYKTTQTFPHNELFALTDQLKRSASSVSANIAEGSGSSSKKDFSRYLDISLKSIYETVSHLYLAKELNYISDEQRLPLYEEAEVLVKRIKAFKVWLSKNH
jgi:four helix bundle protein